MNFHLHDHDHEYIVISDCAHYFNGLQARRYSAVPRLRRKDSYSEAQLDCLAVPIPVRRHSVDTLLDNSDSTSPTQRRKRQPQPHSSQHETSSNHSSRPASPKYASGKCAANRNHSDDIWSHVTVA